MLFLNLESRARQVLASLALVLVSSSTAFAAATDKLQEFSLDQVRLTDPYQQNLFSIETTYLLATLDPNRLLAGFAAVFHNVTPTNLYGGWEGTNLRGHTLGHWMSALAHAYQQAKGNDETLAAQIKAKLDDTVSKLQSYQATDGFLFATPITQFDDFEAGTGSTWLPYYTLHKILAGLIDVYKFEDSPDALTVAGKLGDWLYNRASGWTASQKARVLGQDYGGMNDALYELYKLTNNPNHLAVAHIFDDTALFTALAAGTDNLNGKDARMTTPKFIGALNRYRTLGTGESSYLDAASGFFDIVVKDHSYVTGGNSQDEHFHAAGALDTYRDNVNNESCIAYNMSKLTRDLFMVTGDAKYADFYERIHINEVLASINPETGMTTYFKPMGTGYFKVFSSALDHFWCCTGTGMENFTRLGESLYFHDDKDLWITYYVSSSLSWSGRGLSLTQTSTLPLSNLVTITISAAPTDAVNLHFRKPDWTSTCPMAISVNDQPVTATEASGFLSVSRVWQAGDKVVLAFPLFAQASRLADNPMAVAFTYGPLVLSAGLGTTSMTTTLHGVMVLVANLPTGLQDTIAITSGTTINDWLANIQGNLVKAAGKLEFTLKNTDSDSTLKFIPHYSRYTDRYGIYWKLSGTEGTPATTTVSCPSVGAGGAGGSGGTSGTGGTGGTSGAGGIGGTSGTGGLGGTSGMGGTGGTGTEGSGGTGGGAGASDAGSGDVANVNVAVDATDTPLFAPDSKVGEGDVALGRDVGVDGANASDAGLSIGATDTPLAILDSKVGEGEVALSGDVGIDGVVASDAGWSTGGTDTPLAGSDAKAEGDVDSRKDAGFDGAIAGETLGPSGPQSPQDAASSSDAGLRIRGRHGFYEVPSCTYGRYPKEDRASLLVLVCVGWLGRRFIRRRLEKRPQK